MVNRITIWLISFCLGALSAVFWPRLPTKIELTILLTVPFALCTLAMLLSLYSRHLNKTFDVFTAKACKVNDYCALVLSGCVAGALLVASVGHYHYAWQLPNDKIQKEIPIRARVLEGGCIPSVNIQSEYSSTFKENYKYLVKFIVSEPAVTRRNRSQINTQRRAQNRKGKKDSTLEKLPPVEGGADFLVGKKGLLSMADYTLVKDVDAKRCLHNGDEFSAVVKLKPRYSTQNPVGFNKQKQLLVDNVHVTGYIKTLHSASVKHKHSFRLRMAAELNNIEIQNRIWWQALLVGIRVNFDKSYWHLLQVTGTGHLFSISGMHLGVVAAYILLLSGGFLLVLGYTTRLVQHFAPILRLPHWLTLLLFSSKEEYESNLLFSIKYRIMVIMAVWVVCGFYAALSGLALPVVRAFVLLTIASLFSLFFIAYRPIHLATTMVAMSILLFPLSILSASFYLSVCAVLYIWFLTTRFPTANASRFSTLVGLQFLLGVFMAPLTIIFFNSISIAGLVANIIAVPVITLLLPPALIILLVLTLLQGYRELSIGIVYRLAELLFTYLDSALSWLLSVLRYISLYDWAAVAINVDSEVAACLLVFMMVLIAPSWRYKRHALFVLTVPFIALYIPSNPEQWKVHVLDAGQASAIVVIKGERAMVIDSGASYRNLAYTASAVLLPLLKRQGVEAIDIIVHTHKDNDHAGGKAALLSSPLAKNALWFSPTKNCERGHVERWQGLAIHFLWPKSGNTINNNEHSCVLRITNGQHSILLPGDIERTTEYAIINLSTVQSSQQFFIDTGIQTQNQAPTEARANSLEEPQNINKSRTERHQTNFQAHLNADVLIAPHHGSNTSSTDVFLKSVAPKAVIFTQGFENRWQFPAKEVITRYDALNIPYYMTSFHGYLTITFPADNSSAFFNINAADFTIDSQRFDLNKRWYLDARYPTHLSLDF
ncbi:DNA internalization-related competence protein ComEC/Rec2 [Alteromonas sp. A081]|uniref:DNA internalization-related competence protein ComEC/Rec2 n=1 Tax=Alteromonas sp. A081 TaxID=3410269 RepID=UPI003B982AEE